VRPEPVNPLTALQAIYEAFAALYIALAQNGAVAPGQVPDNLRRIGEGPNAYPELRDLLNEIAAGLDAIDNGGRPALGVIDGGKR
jgi:hypothetical protein